jgi:predicted nucleic-acid-binding protein
MIGLDTQCCLALFASGRSKQTCQANQIFDRQLSEQAPWFNTLALIEKLRGYLISKRLSDPLATSQPSLAIP